MRIYHLSLYDLLGIKNGVAWEILRRESSLLDFKLTPHGFEDCWWLCTAIGFRDA